MRCLCVHVRVCLCECVCVRVCVYMCLGLLLILLLLFGGGGRAAIPSNTLYVPCSPHALADAWISDSACIMRELLSDVCTLERSHSSHEARSSLLSAANSHRRFCVTISKPHFRRSRSRHGRICASSSDINPSRRASGCLKYFIHPVPCPATNHRLLQLRVLRPPRFNNQPCRLELGKRRPGEGGGRDGVATVASSVIDSFDAAATAAAVAAAVSFVVVAAASANSSNGLCVFVFDVISIGVTGATDVVNVEAIDPNVISSIASSSAKLEDSMTQ